MTTARRWLLGICTWWTLWGLAFSQPQMEIFTEGGRLGIRVEDISAEEAARYGLSSPAGARVLEVEEGSGAEKAGIQEGDLIVEFDGEKIRSATQLNRVVRETPAERSVGITLRRGKEQKNVTATLGAARGFRAFQSEVPRLPRFDFGFEGEGPFLREPGRLGIQVQDLNEQLAEHFGAKEGVLVVLVNKNSPADKAGLKAGDVITDLDGTPVRDPSELRSGLRKKDRDAKVSLRIVRDKKTMTLEVQLSERPARSPGRKVRI
ncbi:MAG: PDZ domain-containing protein [Acidobacteria bacterium]|nr:PDZ domain-containing protein [Acidobacteriota bacterium]